MLTAARIALLLALCAGAHGGPLVLRGGLVHTLDAARPRATAIVVEDGRIAYVGDDEGARAHVTPDARVVDLAGRLVLPGFHDAHVHPMSGGLRLLESAPPSEARYREALRRSTALLNRYGVTSVFDASAPAELVSAYHAADRAGELTLRVVAAQRVDLRRGPEQVDEMAERRERTRGKRFRADAAKIFLDGEIGEHTAAMLAPYADVPAATGKLYAAPAALDALVRRLDADGFMVHMHVMGDGAVRAGLDAIERAMRANPPRDRRHQLAHLGVVHPDDIPRFARLGVGANFTPHWAHADDPAMAPIQAALGSTRARWIHPIASIAAAGATITGSSDWPSDTMNPLVGIQVAVTRQPLDGSKPPVQPGERITLAAAIAAYTRNAAWAAREDALNGTIEVGKAADLVVLEKDLFAIGVREIHKVGVLLTLLDGEPVYRDPAFPWPQ
jgi:predicted amidohydrolase YtcJ